MRKQKKTMMVLLLVVLIGLLGYFLLKDYSRKAEDAEATKEENEKIVLSEIELDDIASFSYQADGENLTFSKLDDQWVCSEHQDYNLDETLVDNIASAFTDVEATCIVEEPMEMSEYGLDSPSENISVTTNDGETVFFEIGNKNDVTGDYYVTVSSDDNLYMVESSFASSFNKTIDSLIAEGEEESEAE